MRIFDSHTHLNSAEFIQDVPRFLKQARDLDVVRMAIVGSNTQMNADALQLARTYPELVAIVGWHPEDSKNYTAATEKVLIDQLQQPEVVALGEIGLDYHWDTSPRDTQQKIFARQVAIAKDLNMPISVHNRDAFADTYRILKEADIRDTGGVMHSFNGDPEWLKRFLDLGMHISYSGVASFKNAREVHASVQQTPLDKLLVETDAPYLTPEPYRGKQNQPAYTRYVVEAIAKLRETTPAAIAAQTYQNAEEFFKIEEN
ncbi:TatD family hydrolase [Lactiplantibacillus modestisalitolerans]|uniref:TatD family hydrolase n=1 Tax=Lactiplantibacillus modestisalitolerans TaxID=1457219 RepID=A0ABV5WTU8_9LACO|nr:TatD family hydrolase [Lactiplantibacillus modestisalitolerans]